MSSSTSYVYDSTGNFRAEVIQVDNTAAAVNVSVNLQFKVSAIAVDHLSFVTSSPAVIGAKYHPSGTNAFDYRIRIESEPGHSGTWTTIVNKWCATLSRSGNTGFSLTCQVTAEDDYEELYYFDITNQVIAFKGYVPDDVADNLSNYSSATLGSAITFTVTNGGSYAAHVDTLTYTIGSASGTISSNIAVSSGGETTVPWTPNASLGAQFPTAMSGTCTLTLITKNSGGTEIGRKTYTCTLNVPSYSYSSPSTPTASKVNYTGIGGTSYVAGKHKVSFAVAAPPSGKYGATVTGSLKLYYTGGSVLVTYPITGATNIEYTLPSTAGTFVAAYSISDGRGKNAQNVNCTLTVIANPVVQLSFAAQRDGATTTVNIVASGTYSSTVEGNTATLSLYEGSSASPFDSVSGSGGTASITTTRTLATSASSMYKAEMIDALGNTATLQKNVPIAFAYMQIGTGAGKGVSIGRYGTMGGNVNRLEVGLETSIPSFFPYMETDADGNSMLSAWEVFLPRVTRSMLGLSDNTISAGLEAYLKWVVKNVAQGNTRTRGLFVCGNLYSVDVEMYSKTVDTNGSPQYSAGIAYTYGMYNLAYRFGTNNYSFYITAISDVICRPTVYKSYLGYDTNNIQHATDSVIHASHVGYADLGLTTSSTMAEGFKALTDWLKTNYASDPQVNKSRCIVCGTFSGRSNGSIDRNMMYQVMFYDISQAESNGTAPRYCCGWAMMLSSLKLFTFRNNNGTFDVYEHTGTQVTA